ncbi:M56 family metallopeptidase [Hymenobacter jejuensis]|uniref:M56 family metallopeptidase n=1 Tax=Hymenobacter jejuensis TaxID=2502781 RepID=A0A5B8A0M6_9BACT|nr:M56 family metallopeptidase [Hymenobacter jejuensis]QDA60991.1 M56 family metallopeptidase [Hymenobacter jejuensis]
MNWLEHFLSPALVRALGWTLVHSIWQGAVVALALAGLLLLLRRHSAQVRYATAAAALVTLLSLAVVTFGRHYYVALRQDAVAASVAAAAKAEPVASTSQAFTQATAAAPITAASAAETPTTGIRAWLNYFDQNIPVMVAAWLLGLLAMMLRLLGGLAYVQRLRHYRVQPLAPEWTARIAVLAEQAGVRQPIALLESALVKVPLVVGHLRPVILLPFGTVTGLSQSYMEAILAHELAHIARRDYLMNLLQSIAEILFFYHPAVWFVTACMRTERENCCDDAATALVGGDPLRLARALAALAELGLERTPAARLALSAVGPDGSLLGRIRRLVQGRSAPTFSEGFMAACVVLCGLVLLTTAVAMADPRPLLTKTGTLGKLSNLPLGQKLAEECTDLPLVATSLAPLAQTEPLAPVAAASQQDGDNDGDKDKNKKRKRTERVVVVNGSRRSGGTVVIEKDKKGRITDMFVDGERVEGVASGSKSKTTLSKIKDDKGGKRVEVVKVVPNGSFWSKDGDNFTYFYDPNFKRNFTFRIPAGDQAEIERSVRRAQANADAATRRSLQNLRLNQSFTYSFPGDQTPEDANELARRALRQADEALRRAEQAEKSEETRARLREERERIREKQEELRERLREEEESRRDSDEARREVDDERRRTIDESRLAIEERRRELEEKRRDMEEMRRDREAERAERERHRADEEQKLKQELVKDKLITDTRNYELTLTASEMTVNGKKQPESIHQKYLKLYEARTGHKMTGSSMWRARENNDSRSSETPPTPPKAPQAPKAPRPPRTPRSSGSQVTPPTPPALEAPAAPAAPPAPTPPTGDVIINRPATYTVEVVNSEVLNKLNEHVALVQLTSSSQSQTLENLRQYRRLVKSNAIKTSCPDQNPSNE